MYAFVSGKFNDDEPPQPVRVDVLRISQVNYRSFLRLWVTWPRKSGSGARTGCGVNSSWTLCIRPRLLNACDGGIAKSHFSAFAKPRSNSSRPGRRPVLGLPRPRTRAIYLFERESRGGGPFASKVRFGGNRDWEATKMPRAAGNRPPQEAFILSACVLSCSGRR
jgi:hypothetical protein